MQTAILFDCEFLTVAGAPQRFWCGPHDPDPVVAQIGAVRLALTPEADILGRFCCVVQPPARGGGGAEIPAFFTRLTGVSAQQVADGGLPLDQALAQLDRFADGAPFWSWGKDEFNMLAISCFVADLPPPIPAARFGNAARLLLLAGVPAETIHGLRSPGLPGFFGLPSDDLRAHDALGDAEAVARALQHLIREGRLPPGALAAPLGPDPARLGAGQRGHGPRGPET